MPTISSGGPTTVRPGEDREAVQNILLGTEPLATVERQLSTDALLPWTLGISPASLGVSVEDFLTMSREQLEDLQANFAPAIGQKQQGANAAQVQFRPLWDQEVGALVFTFGDTVAKRLIDIIELGPAGEAPTGKIRLVLPSGYNPDDLDSLATFIYEATRVWQIDVGQFLEDRDEDNPDYTYKDLYKLELTSTQHAEAVKDWFYVNYGIETGEVSFAKDQIKFEGLWKKTLTVLGLTRWDRSKFGKKNRGGQERALQQTVNNHYGCVIKALRDAKPIQVLVPTENTEITTFADVKVGL